MSESTTLETNIVVKVDNNVVQTPSDKCLCCLSKNLPLVNLATCKHTSFFDFFYKFKVDYESSVICRQCHHILKKIDAFRTQVDDSFRILSDQVEKTQIKKHQDLQISKTKLTDLSTDEEVLYLKLEPMDTPAISPKDDYSVKIEFDSCTDVKPDVPLPEVKKEAASKKVVVKKKKAVKTKKAGSDTKKVGMKNSSILFKKKYGGKITIVTLTTEEIMLEREVMAQRESYLKLPFKCESCITGFEHELSLEEHNKKRHTEKEGGHVCEICKSVLSSLTSYKDHNKRHARRYECAACGKRNNNVYSVAKHYNDAHGRIDTQFSCDDCGFTTQSYRSYRYHRDKHRQKQQCALCGSTFVNSAVLRVHMFNVHKQSTHSYPCSECGKTFSTKAGITAHARTHTHRQGAWCVTCHTHFRTEQSLAHHLRTHSRHLRPDDKKFACTECDAKFVARSALREHVDYVHLKSNKYECEECSKVFKNNTALKRHDKFVHKKIRPPSNKICDYCGRGFTKLSILQAHIRTHTGEKPLHCPHCPATFAHSATLYTHEKLMHKRSREAAYSRKGTWTARN